MGDEAETMGGGGPSTPGATAAVAQSRGEGGAPPAAKPAAPSAHGGVGYRLGQRLTAASTTTRAERSDDDPVYRPLQIYTIDPTGRRLEGKTAEINVPYERLEPGPVGKRFEVIVNPQGPMGKYDPVDLDEPRLLIANGRVPAPTDVVFHHQMVYAVAMSTFAIFRNALGREPTWGFANQRLTLVPHASQEANAAYSRDKQSLEFGWFRVKPESAGKLPPNGLVFACLSHDIIAHELTHALLDGMRVRFNTATNRDVSAFHEAFADLVALLQRFSYRKVVVANILKTNGDLTKDNDLLNMVFELALGQGGSSLRQVDLTASKKYDSTLESHELGLVLVSAVIEAFLTIYKRRSAPLIRMATNGLTSVPPDRAMPYELMNELTKLASGLASQVLNMCVRAIDYCPPVDITLGEYLRALITADYDLVPDDPYAYREAMVDAFVRRKIYPPDVTALTEDGLLWKAPLHKMREPQLDFGALRFSGDPGQVANKDELLRQARLIGELVTKPANLADFGLAALGDPALGGDRVDPPVVESVRCARRVGPDGQLAFDLVAEVSQKRKVPGGGGLPGFDFYGGATIIFGSRGEVRYVVSKGITNSDRLTKQQYLAATDGADVFGAALCRHSMRLHTPLAEKA